MTCEFLESRNMDCKDRVYTKRVKEMQVRLKDIIKKRANIVVRQMQDIDMIIDYFSYACIYGCDVAEDKQVYDFEKLVKDIPEKTLKTHMLIQTQIEQEMPAVRQGYLDVAEEESRRAGWDNLAQQEYFTNLDKYEDLSFVGQERPLDGPQPPQSSKRTHRDSSTREAHTNAPESSWSGGKRLGREKLTTAQTMVVHDRQGATFELDDDDFAAEEGVSPALLGGFTVPKDLIDGKLPEPVAVGKQELRREYSNEDFDSEEADDLNVEHQD